MRTVWTSALAWMLLSCANDYDIVAEPVDVDPGEVAECGFSPISDTRISEYDCNPVFSGTDEEWGDAFISVGFRTQQLLGHPFYQIWYSARPADVTQDEWHLGYAVSDNGTDWETHPNNPLVSNTMGAWDEDQMDGIQILWDPERAEYVLWYQGFDIASNRWGMGVKTSPDGADWSAFNNGKMIVDFTSPASSGVTYCWPLGVSYATGFGYTGFLAGQPGAMNNVCQMYRFVGENLEDGQSFDFGAQPVLTAGPENYDAAGHASVAVVEYGPDEWYMFYVGFREWVQNAGYQSSHKHSFNMATSTDGTNWTKSSNNPLPINNASPGVIRDVAAQKYGSRVFLWITDYYEDIDQMAVGFYIFEPTAEVHP